MRESRKTALTTIVLVVVGLVSIGISRGTDVSSDGRFRPEQIVRSILAGGQKIFAGVGRTVSGTLRSVGELRRLREDYEGLLEELEQYQRLEGNIAALASENARLREQLGFVARSEEALLAARVIARESAGLFSSYTINRGRRHGVRPDQAVIAFIVGREGLVGRVSEVSGGTAVIIPVFAPGSYVATRLDRSRYEGLLQGTGDDSDPLIMRYVPRGARDEIRYDDLISTSGLQSIFPANLPVGRVTRVTAPSYETSLIISVEPVVDFSRLEYVFVLVNTGRREEE